MRKIKLIIEYEGRETTVNSIGELVSFCCSKKEDESEVLWWRDGSPSTEKNPWGYKEFTQTELLKELEKSGELSLQFGPPDKSNTGEIFFIYTEKGHAKMLSDVEASMTELAQDYADQTGKPATVRNMMGSSVTVKPKKKK